ncbi:hypothetical protein QBC37DRAFT_477717 [Rhypophila decipiens]|uniref:Uncharacterized protein n=1 Tax=Rhypophila decipiens TaxID=261697 RepID=A0AAN7BDB9_9PEZI|nr:hypothetical protein QBC37DRAFT_477717 [Rhypophila decipiens]
MDPSSQFSLRISSDSKHNQSKTSPKNVPVRAQHRSGTQQAPLSPVCSVYQLAGGVTGVSSRRKYHSMVYDVYFETRSSNNPRHGDVMSSMLTRRPCCLLLVVGEDDAFHRYKSDGAMPLLSRWLPVSVRGSWGQGVTYPCVCRPQVGVQGKTPSLLVAAQPARALCLWRSSHSLCTLQQIGGGHPCGLFVVAVGNFSVPLSFLSWAAGGRLVLEMSAKVSTSPSGTSPSTLWLEPESATWDPRRGAIRRPGP